MLLTATVAAFFAFAAEHDAVPFSLGVYWEVEVFPVERVLVWNDRVLGGYGLEVVESFVQHERHRVDVGEVSVCGEGCILRS